MLSRHGRLFGRKRLWQQPFPGRAFGSQRNRNLLPYKALTAQYVHRRLQDVAPNKTTSTWSVVRHACRRGRATGNAGRRRGAAIFVLGSDRCGSCHQSAPLARKPRCHFEPNNFALRQFLSSGRRPALARALSPVQQNLLEKTSSTELYAPPRYKS
jgi:hypothetical protein